MSDICRLCLSFSTENMRPLFDCDGFLLNTIKIQNLAENVLPSHICCICYNKLTDFNNFYQQVQHNQATLLLELNKGGNALDIFYEQIKNRIKKENYLLTDENIDTTKENELIIEQIKKEEFVNSDFDKDFDSEDDMPLLKTRESNIEDTENEKDIKTEFDKGFDSDDDMPLLKRRDSNVEDTENLKNIKTELEQDSDANNYTKYYFKCLTCFEILLSQKKLLNHYNNEHKSKEEIKGNQYTQVINDEEILYKCNQCEKVYDNVRSVNKHAKTHCDANFHCKVCGRTYKTVSEIIRHGRAHDGTKMTCSFGCGFGTVYSGALKSHERRHRDEFKYKCETCDKSFQVKTWYEQHQNIHTGVSPYVCDICGMAFHMDRYLKAHVSSAHDALSTKRYACVQCGKPCPSMKALTRHLKEHGITSSVLCDLCGKTLSSSEQLAIHRRLHTGVKPYSCSMCSKSFAKSSNLKLHQITHSGERSHACAACGKRYSQRSAMLRHVHRHHTSEKKCPKCDATFATQAELGTHQKTCAS